MGVSPTKACPGGRRRISRRRSTRRAGKGEDCRDEGRAADAGLDAAPEEERLAPREDDGPGGEDQRRDEKPSVAQHPVAHVPVPTEQTEQGRRDGAQRPEG